MFSRNTTSLTLFVFLAGLSFALPRGVIAEGAETGGNEGFVPKRYFIIAQGGDHGRIEPSGLIRAREGTDQTFTILADNGYRIAGVTVDGVSQGSLSAYTFYNVTAHHRIVATFAKEAWGGEEGFYSALPPGRAFYYGEGNWGAPVGVDQNSRRTIEEGDIAKVSGATVFILNQYRGLQIIDVSDTNNPSLLSSVPLCGSPVELYVRGDTVYVIVSSYSHYYYTPLIASGESVPKSQIIAVDVSDTRSPQILAAIEREGSITDTRIVGDILYVVANQYAFHYGYGPREREHRTGVASVPRVRENRTIVSSVAMADPSRVRVVDEMSFETASSVYENNVHVTENQVFLARYRSEVVAHSGNWITRSVTDVTSIDISDEEGTITKGATFTVPGVISNRWQMDFYNGYFRTITPEETWGNGYPCLYVYRVADPDTIERVSQLTLVMDRPEALMSVRFYGDTAYAVTYERIDPLFTLDLSDPAQPRQLGEIEMTGWIDYIEPRTDHLVTLGHDDAGETLSLAVSLFDVTSIDNPILVERVTVGEGYGWVPTDINDMRKAFRVLDESNLVLVPFSSWSSTDARQISGVQLIDYFFDPQQQGLEKRGLIEHSGWVARALPFDATTVLTVSNEAFQSVDISDRDNPAIKKALELARNTLDIAQLSQGTGLELSAERQSYSYAQGAAALSVVPLDNPNTPEPADSLRIEGFFDKLFSMRDSTLLAGYGYDEEKGNVTVVKTVRYEDNDFTMLDSLEVEGLSNYGGMYGNSLSLLPYRPSSQVVKLSDTALALVGSQCFYPFMEHATTSTYDLVMKVVDVSDPQALRVASTVNLVFQDGFLTFVLWDGAKAYLSFMTPYRAEEGMSYYRNYLKIVDFSDIDHPVVSPAINVPGNVVGTSPDGAFVYTIDYQYGPPPFSSSHEVYLSTAEIIEDQAELKDREKIVPAPVHENEYLYCGNVVADNEKAYVVVTRSLCEPDYAGCRYSSHLVTADLSDPEHIRFSSSQSLEKESADIVKAIQEKLFLYTYSGGGGIIIYALDDPLAPNFESFTRTDYFPEKIVIINDKAYLPSGMYGIKVIQLQ